MKRTLAERDIWTETWISGPYAERGLVRKDIEGGFVHMIRAADDPERSARGSRHGEETRVVRRIHRLPQGEIRWAILRHVADGEPRTFNRICVELWDVTADIAGDAITKAFFDLVEERLLQHTNDAPVLWLPVWEGDNLPPKLPRPRSSDTADGQVGLDFGARDRSR